MSSLCQQGDDGDCFDLLSLLMLHLLRSYFIYFIMSAFTISMPSPVADPAHTPPIRVLHILGGLDQGGIETWLMHVLRGLDRQQVAMDFLIHAEHDCAYAEEVRRLGGRIFVCPYPERPWRYARDFCRIVRRYGPYDIVHSHVHHFSGYVLYLAKCFGITSRIAHSHNDTTVAEQGHSRWRQYYLAGMRWAIQQYATLGLACSEEAGADLFGRSWGDDRRWQTIYYGIRLPNAVPATRNVDLRGNLGIPANAFVIGHVGRLVEQKNHDFLLEIAAELVKQHAQLRLLLIGQGELQPHLTQRIAELGLGGHVMLLGTRSDILPLMRDVMDIFVFPSRHEGLGIVLLEAQAMGLPCVISDVIPAAVDVIPEIVQRVSLDQAPVTWANAISNWRHYKQMIDADGAMAELQRSPFNIAVSQQCLLTFYQSQMGSPLAVATAFPKEAL
jgi:glycosyltransferase involved in cell wall biosynthesis